MEDMNITQKLNIDEMLKTIPIVCSWCNQIYHMKQWDVDPGKTTGISHGMCPDCELKQLKELNELIAKKEKDEKNK